MITKPKNKALQVSCLPNRREYSDHELVAGMIKKDTLVSSAFFDVYGEKINQLVWTLLRSEEDHNDTVHSALVAIMQNIKKLRDPSRLSGWISRITINTVRNEIRRRQLRRRFTIDIEQPEDWLEPVSMPPGDIVGRLNAVLKTMSPDSQIIFVLHYIEGYSTIEIADLQGRSESTVKRRRRRCKAEFLEQAASDMVLAGYIEDVDEKKRI